MTKNLLRRGLTEEVTPSRFGGEGLPNHTSPDGKATLWATVPRRLYGCLPLKRGLGRFIMLAARYREHLHMIPVEMSDGRIMYLDLREPMCMPYLLTGGIWEERGETQFFRSLVQPGELAVDIGANVGWYSTLLSQLVGSGGRVYAFELNPRAYRLLSQSARPYAQLLVIDQALGDENKEVNLYLPADGGMASIGRSFNIREVQTCGMTTLDDFLASRGEPVPAFIKCDAEGAELAILRGATRTTSSPRPPLWMIELCELTCESLGYRPEAIIGYFKTFPKAGYQGYRINSQTGMLVAMPASLSFRFNAVFVPAWLQERVAELSTARVKGRVWS